MQQALHLEGDPGTVLAAWGQLDGALQTPTRKLTLRIANRLFGEASFHFEQPYLDATAAAFGAPLERLDFQHAAEAQRARINGWVEAETERRIKDLLGPGSVSAATRLVLVNAVYFLADWAEPFEKEATSDQPFTLAAGQRKNVATMHQRGGFRVAHLDGVSLLELPYQGDAAMIFVLPDQLDGLAAVEGALDPATFERWRAALAPSQVAVSLPRFRIDPPQPTELSSHLTALGMADAFDSARADFSGIAAPADSAQRLSISAVVHKAFVKVDEKGTEAAAATAVVMEGAGAAPRPVPELKLDHPFLFFIVDQPSGLILFMGRVADPSAV
jgi:serpin B